MPAEMQPEAHDEIIDRARDERLRDYLHERPRLMLALVDLLEKYRVVDVRH